MTTGYSEDNRNVGQKYVSSPNVTVYHTDPDCNAVHQTELYPVEDRQAENLRPCTQCAGGLTAKDVIEAGQHE